MTTVRIKRINKMSPFFFSFIFYPCLFDPFFFFFFLYFNQDLLLKFIISQTQLKIGVATSNFLHNKHTQLKNWGRYSQFSTPTTEKLGSLLPNFLHKQHTTEKLGSPLPIFYTTTQHNLLGSPLPIFYTKHTQQLKIGVTTPNFLHNNTTQLVGVTTPNFLHKNTHTQQLKIGVTTPNFLHNQHNTTEVKNCLKTLSLKKIPSFIFLIMIINFSLFFFLLLF
jgi:hypothetical protein